MEFNVSKDVAKSYQNNGPAMVDFVNRHVAEKSNSAILIGGNPLEMMYSNHRHHHLFMSQVMAFNAWDMLNRMVPWVYSTYKNHGFSHDYFLAEFEGWIAASRNFLSPEVSKVITEIYEAFIAEHESNIQTSLAYSPKLVEPSARFKDSFESFIEMLTTGDSDGATDFANQVVSTAKDLGDFYLGLLMPTLVEIGNRWEKGKLTVANEHLASGIANRLMAHWYNHVLKGDKKRGKALIAASPGEFHTIGGAMISDLLSIDGWQTIFLGANTPGEDLLNMIETSKPDMLLISVTMPFNISQASEVIQAVKNSESANKCRVYIGGQAFDFAPELWEQTGADAYLKNANDVVVDARKIKTSNDH